MVVEFQGRLVEEIDEAASNWSLLRENETAFVTVVLVKSRPSWFSLTCCCVFSLFLSPGFQHIFLFVDSTHSPSTPRLARCEFRLCFWSQSQVGHGVAPVCVCSRRLRQLHERAHWRRCLSALCLRRAVRARSCVVLGEEEVTESCRSVCDLKCRLN